MNNSGTICQSYILITYNVKCFLTLLCSLICRTLVQWLVFFALQFCSLIRCKYFVSVFSFFCKSSKNGIKQCTCHIINSSVCCLYLCIILFWIYAECKVGWKCPWCCCPCKNIRILIFDFKADDCRTLLDILISLCNFLCRKRCSTTRAVRNNLESFVKESFIPNFLQSPPLRLDEIVVIRYIWMLHISPEPNCAGEVFPHSFVFPYTFFTFLDEWFKTVFLDLILSVQSEHLLNFQLYRKTMRIPSCLSRNHITFHCAVSRNHILDNTGQNVSDMRLAIGCRRSVIENIIRASFFFIHTLLEDIFVIPEFFNFFFTLNKIHVC